MRLAGRILGRPSEELLLDLTGRSRGGPVDAPIQEGGQGIERGRRALDHRQYGEALVQFAQAAESAPHDPWPWHGRGDALQLSGDPVGALEAYEAALARIPNLAVSHLGRGNALESLDRLDEARDAWREALKHDPDLDWAQAGLNRIAGHDE
jgi:tetratricopeptide (TPR) repeat protein